MRVLLLLALVFSSAATAAPKRLELGFPQLKERVQVVLPENYSADKKWPAIFYYHGTGGKPTTELMQAHTMNKDWIVVGMTYIKQGKLDASFKAIDEEYVVFASARRHLATKWNLDPKRCYIAGFSKGGWMSGFMLQRDSSLAGAIILGAGHRFDIKKPTKFRSPKSLFVGIGRSDEVYPFALRALVHYRPLGARTTFETWHDLGHSFPPDGSQALRQWLALEAHPKTNQMIAAESWVRTRIDEIKGLPNPVNQWVAYRDLEETPYLKLLGDEGKSKVQALIAKLEKGGRVAAEVKALNEHRVLLRKELNGHTIPLCQQLAGGYLKLSESHPGTRQAVFALGDHARMKKLALHFKEQVKIEKQKQAEAKNLVPPKKPVDPFPTPPENRPRIPRNPLIT